jgi:hypothetical protein
VNIAERSIKMLAMNTLVNFLNETSSLHDSNIENIDIKIHLSENSNRKLSNKIIILSFFNVVEYKINKTDNWEWLIYETKLLQENEYFKIIIDDFVLIKFSECKINY